MDGLFDAAVEGVLTDPIIAIGNIIALSYLIPLIAFIAQYWRRSPWWVTDLGVALMAQKIAFIGIFVLIDLGLFFRDWPARPYVRVALYLLVLISFILDQVNLNRYQRRGHYDRVRFPRPPLYVIVRAQFTGEDLTAWKRPEKASGAPR